MFSVELEPKVLFVLNFVGFVGFTGYGGVQFSHRQAHMTNGTLVDVNAFDRIEVLNIAGATGIAAGAVLVFAVVWMWLSRSFARQLIIFTIVLNILVWLAGGRVSKRTTPT